MASKENIERLLADWLEGRITTDELKSKVGTRDFAQYERILAEVDSWEVPDNYQVDLPSLWSARNKEKSKMGTLWRPLLVAASVVLIVSLGILFFVLKSDTSFVNTVGQTQKIILPDNSSYVILGPNAQLSYSSDNWKDEREVKLEGKAYFDISSGNNTFKVITNAGQVQVLGTEFDVSSVNNSLEVKCYEGAVSVTAEGRKVVIEAGSAQLFFSGKWEDRYEILNDSPDWIDSKISFKNTPLPIVIKELKSIYGVEIENEGVAKNRRFTGSIPIDDKEASIQIVFNSMSIDYKLDGSTLYLSE